MKKITLQCLAFFSVLFFGVSQALAQQTAKPLDFTLQPAATPQMERISWFHNHLLFYIITAIVIFVTALLAYVLIRFNAKANPTPSKTTHHVPLEIMWTVLPVIILIVIAVPSFKMLFYLDRTDSPDMTLKITGNQWNWTYEYQEGEENNISFTSIMIPENEIDESIGQRRLLSTDNPVVLPIDTNIRLLITAPVEGVIHSFTVPAFGVKKDAVPGRMNETWVRIDKPGTYFGQCSEICGKDHAYMPIEIKAVPKEEYEAWKVKAKEEFSSLSLPNITPIIA